MSNKFALKAWAEPLRSVAFGSITSTMAAIGSPFVYPPRVLFVTNGTDATIFFGFKPGATSNAQFALLAGTSMSLDVTANTASDDGLYFAIGTQPYIAYASAPTSGFVYVSVVYGTTGLTS